MTALATVLGLLIAQQSAGDATIAAPPSALACAAEGHDGFDFWIGEWDVHPNGQDGVIANSRIERLHSGCAIREQWMPLGGTGGSSLSHMDPDSGRWHQLWIGSSPGSVSFEGGVVDGKMVLTGYWADIGGPGMDGLVRMTYTALSEDSVRQFGEMSLDHGLTWQVSFDLIYERRSEPL
jgi:hypothetical protein